MIDTGAGVVDADYRGVLFVLLFNLSDKDFQGIALFQSLLAPSKDRISQLKKETALRN